MNHAVNVHALLHNVFFSEIWLPLCNPLYCQTNPKMLLPLLYKSHNKNGVELIFCFLFFSQQLSFTINDSNRTHKKGQGHKMSINLCASIDTVSYSSIKLNTMAWYLRSKAEIHYIASRTWNVNHCSITYGWALKVTSWWCETKLWRSFTKRILERFVHVDLSCFLMKQLLLPSLAACRCTCSHAGWGSFSC